MKQFLALLLVFNFAADPCRMAAAAPCGLCQSALGLRDQTDALTLPSRFFHFAIGGIHELLSATWPVVQQMARYHRESPYFRFTLWSSLGILALAQWFQPLLEARGSAPMDFQVFYSGVKLWFSYHLNPQIVTPDNVVTFQHLFRQWDLPIYMDSSGKIQRLIDNYIHDQGYWNSPAVLILLAPLVKLPVKTAYVVFVLVGRLAFFLIAQLVTWRLARGSRWVEKRPALVSSIVALSLYEPVHWSLMNGQVEFLYLLPAVLALTLVSAPRWSDLRQKSGILSLAVGFITKLIPGIFIFIFAKMDLRRLRVALKRARDDRYSEFLMSLLKTFLVRFVLATGLLALLIGAVTGFQSIPLWMEKWSRIQAQARLSSPLTLNQYVDAISSWFKTSIHPAVVWIIRLILVWPMINVLNLRDRDRRSLWLKAAVPTSLLPTLLLHWYDYYFPVFIIPLWGGWLMAKELPSVLKTVSRILFAIGFIGTQTLHNYFIGYPFGSRLARIVYSPLQAILRIPLPLSFAAFAPPSVGRAQLGDLLAYPASLAIFLGLILVARNFARVTCGGRRSPFLTGRAA